MKVSELPQEVQERIAKERAELTDINNFKLVLLYDKTKRIFFMAKRKWEAGMHHAYDGMQYWQIYCGKVVVKHSVRFGFDQYELVKKNCYKKYGGGKDIPSTVWTKAEVIKLAKDIGLFNI